jgi:NADPH-dependent ferric siderophore reductase
VPAFVILEVEDETEQQGLEARAGLSSPADLRLTWLHRDGAGHTDEPRILNLVESLDLPGGRGQAFVHGEAGMVREVRRHLANERGMDLSQLSATGYWKYRRTEEGWREDKPEWKRLAEADLA